MIVDQNMRYKPQHSLSMDEKGKTSQDTAFRGSKTHTATSVTTARKLIGSEWFRTSVLVYNNGLKTIYLGDDTVTTANGMPLLAGGYLPINVGSRLPIYAISAEAGGVELRIWELG